MKFFTDLLYQKKKSGHAVCGDYYLCERFETGTVCVLCDGIGSGVYANISAIICAERLMELLRQGMTLRYAAETVVASMNKIREEEIPFTAFSAARILPDGYLTVYTYKAPAPVYIRDGLAVVLPSRAYSVGYEVINEFTGRLNENEQLLLFSDNTSMVTLGCREANELTLFTGPPGIKSADKKYAGLVLSAKGKKVVCGSTTLDIISRELGIPVEVKGLNTAGAPPEYFLKGIDLASEGAITLNQVCNIIDEPEIWEEDNVVVRLCQLLLEADVIHLIIGTAVNTAHQSQVFRQVGVRVRKSVINLLTDKMSGMGKLIVKKHY